MLNKEQILTYLKAIKPMLEREYHVSSIGLFGSFSTGEQKEDSDIDVIIEFKPETENLFEIKEEIRRLIGEYFRRDVDLCREKYIKPYFKKQILKTAIYA